MRRRRCGAGTRRCPGERATDRPPVPARVGTFVGPSVTFGPADPGHAGHAASRAARDLGGPRGGASGTAPVGCAGSACCSPQPSRTVVLGRVRPGGAARAGARRRRRCRGRRPAHARPRSGRRPALTARGARRRHSRGGGPAAARRCPAHRRDAAGLAGGVLHGWLRTLESTLPAHPDLKLVAFVPALVLLAAVVGPSGCAAASPHR